MQKTKKGLSLFFRARLILLILLVEIKSQKSYPRLGVKKIGVRLRAKVLLYVTQLNDLYFIENDSYENLRFLLIEYKKHKPEYSLIIKVHPGKNEESYHEILKALHLENSVLITRWHNPYKLISFSDRVVFFIR